MLEILGHIIEIWKDLVPDRSLPTPVYLTRLVAIFCMTLCFMSFVVLALKGTELGQKYGLKNVDVVPIVSHERLVTPVRSMWETMSELREQDVNIKAAFITGIVNKSGNFVQTKKELKNGKLLIWIWSIPIDKFYSLNILENAFNNAIKQHPNNLLKEECFVSRIAPDIKEQLERGITDFQSTHLAYCPIFTTIGERRIVAKTSIFFKIDPEFTIGQENNIMWIYEDRLNRLTNAVSPYFANVNKVYEMYYIGQ